MTKPKLTKEYILEELEEMIADDTLHAKMYGFEEKEETRVLRAIRFVLKNRTVENWDPMN